MRKAFYQIGDIVQIKKYLEAKTYYSYGGFVSDSVVPSMQNCAGKFTRIDMITKNGKYFVNCDDHSFGWVDGMFEEEATTLYKEI